jgi:transcriptional regulator with XRE-family HTH domain
MKFGDFVRARRTELGFTLRDFCSTFGYDPSNWSKIERGKLPPSDDQHILDVWAEQLNIKKGTNNWQLFSDLAFQDRGKIPTDILGNDVYADALLQFYKILRERQPTHEDIDTLVDILGKNNFLPEK